jgi:hypothetical protein
MTSRKSFPLVLALCLASIAARAQDIRWAGAVDVARPNILHAPDARFTPADPPLTVSDFAPVMRYSSLISLLRGSRCDLTRADVIAFEGNGGHSAGVDHGWEGSVWTFSDGTVTRTVTYNETIGRASDPSIVCTGSILGPDGSERTGGETYAKFFRICPEEIIVDAPLKRNVISFILFDLHSKKPAVNVGSSSFSIRLANGVGTLGTPDPDAIGVFSACRRR